MHLLVVDDDADFRSLIAESAPAWVNVTPCAGSREAVGIIGEEGAPRPDFAIIDLKMKPHLERLSELEGLALARWIYLNRPKLPMILVSANGLPDTDVGAIGPVGFLRKPLDLTSLYRFLAAYEDLFVGSDVR